MSILIKGMKMPTNCAKCPCNNDEARFCLAKQEYIPMLGKPEFCPLIELPEKHGRLIDADAAMKQWGLDKATKYGNETSEQQRFSYSTMMMYEIADILDDAPVVIEAEGER